MARHTDTRSSPPLRERSEGEFDLAEGTIYPALHRLERAGLIESAPDIGARAAAANVCADRPRP